MVKVDLSGAAGFFTAAGPDYALAELAAKTLADGSGLGAEFTGWLALPQRVKDTELDAIAAAARKIRARSRALVVVGIAGMSDLGEDSAAMQALQQAARTLSAQLGSTHYGSPAVN